KERGKYSVPVLRESVGEQRKRLWSISKTMQEENSVRAPLLQIDRLGAFDYRRLSASLTRHSSSGSHFSGDTEPGVALAHVSEGRRERIRLDEESHAPALRDSRRDESTQCQGNRLPRCTNHLAKKTMMIVLELQSTIWCGEGVVAAQVRERRHQSLINIQRRQLVKFLQQIGAFGHYLRQQWNRLGRTFSHERPELCSAQKHCFGFFGGARIGDVRASGCQTFAAECLPHRRDH